jgi:hypothetical protein
MGQLMEDREGRRQFALLTGHGHFSHSMQRIVEGPSLVGLQVGKSERSVTRHSKNEADSNDTATPLLAQATGSTAWVSYGFGRNPAFSSPSIK